MRLSNKLKLFLVEMKLDGVEVRIFKKCCVTTEKQYHYGPHGKQLNLPLVDICRRDKIISIVFPCDKHISFYKETKTWKELE